MLRDHNVDTEKKKDRRWSKKGSNISIIATFKMPFPLNRLRFHHGRMEKNSNYRWVFYMIHIKCLTMQNYYTFVLVSDLFM